MSTPTQLQANAASDLSENFDSFDLIIGTSTSMTAGSWTFTSIGGGGVALAGQPDFGVWLNHDEGSADKAVILNYEGIDARDFTMRTADGSPFSLSSLMIGNLDGADPTLTIYAYRNGVLVVPGEMVNLNASDSMGNIAYSHMLSDISGRYGRLNFNNAFANVDEIRFSFAGIADLHIDNIVAATPDTAPPIVVNVSIPDAPMKIGDVVTATIIVAADDDIYTLRAGSAIGGYTLSNLHKVSDTTYTATFTITEGSGDILFGANIPVNLVLADSANNSSLAYTSAIVQTNDPIDNTRPSAPSTPDLMAESDTGTLPTDNRTNDTTPSFSGFGAEPNSIVRLYADGVEVGHATASASGDWIVTASVLNSGNYTFSTRVEDAAGNLGAVSGGQVVTIDAIGPSVTSVSVPANATYAAGNDLAFTVNFNEAVTVETGGGTPRMALVIGSQTTYADYVSGTGTTALIFRYTVKSGEADANGITVAALNTNGGTIKDAAGNNAALTLNSVGSTAGVLVDGIAPAVASIVRSGGASLTNATTIDYTVTFSEAVTGVTADDFALNAVGAVGGQITSVTGSGATYTVSVSEVSGAGSIRLDVNGGGTAVADHAGNPLSGGYSSGESYTVDTVAPTVLSATINGDRLVLTYSEKLDIHNGANALIGGYTVMVDGQIVMVSNRAFGTDANTVVITLASPVTKGQSVSVFYEDPTLLDDGDAIQDLAGNDSAGFIDLPVTNTTQDTDKPVITGISIPNVPMALGDEVTVTISVQADDDTYTLGVGSFVGPYELTDLVKVNATTFTAKFTVTAANGFIPADMDINVGISLVDSSANESDPYTQPVSQDGDLIDGIRPVMVSSVANGSSVVLTYSEALDVANLLPAGAFTVKVAGQVVGVAGLSVDSTARTVTLQLLSPVTKGQSVTVSYADPTAGNDAKAVQDLAGNDAASFTDVAVSNITSGSMVDGVEVVETLNRTSDGIESNSILVQSVPSGRVEDTGSATFADIMLKTSEAKGTILAQLATGAGLEAEVFNPIGSINRQDFAIILAKILKLDLNTGVPGGGVSFGDIGPSISDWSSKYVEAALQAGLLSAVTDIKLMGVADRDTIISGLPTYSNVMILDASSDGTHRKLEVNDIGFIVLKGNAEIYGGNGAQFIVGDSASQRIVMGANDDTIHGGAGDDVVGSQGGRDLLFGDDGNDTVFGGEGYDRLEGGAGDDQLDGGTGVDAVHFAINFHDAAITYDADGTLMVSGAGIGTDTLRNIELLHFADQVVLADPPPAHAPGLFNEAWYLAQNPDVAAAVKAGAFTHGYDHFLRYGAQEGRAAAPGSSGWDEQVYLAHNPDVAAAVKAGTLASGFAHFVRHGAQEGRAAMADGQGWDEAFYLAHNPDVAAAVNVGALASGLEHFLRHGGTEGRPADPQALGVDEAFYLAQNPDVAAAVQAGWMSSGMGHYFTWGAQEGRDPNALFDEAWYLSHNLDVAAAVQAGSIASGHEHFQRFGWSEGRDPSAWMDVSAYLNANPDVAAAQVDPLTHCLTYGVREGRAIVAADTDLWV